MKGRGPGTRCSEHDHIHVAVAVVSDAHDRILLARRPEHVHQGGLWEFPGGKLEEGEGVRDALERELHEELGIGVLAARPLIRIHHAYPDRDVLLDVWKVLSRQGEPHGREGQPLAWVRGDELCNYSLPPANLPIVTAARLPGLYLITPEPEDDARFLVTLGQLLDAGVRLVQLRAKTVDDARYRGLAQAALELAHGAGAELILNSDPDLVVELGAHGVHLTGDRLMSAGARPLDRSYWVAASCHSEPELEHACRIGCDFVVLSPVLQTSSHPGAAALEWKGFGALTEKADVPVYALGGMRCEMLDQAFRHGGQGVALISAVWNAAAPDLAVRQCLDEAQGG